MVFQLPARSQQNAKCSIQFPLHCWKLEQLSTQCPLWEPQIKNTPTTLNSKFRSGITEPTEGIHQRRISYTRLLAALCSYNFTGKSGSEMWRCTVHDGPFVNWLTTIVIVLLLRKEIRGNDNMNSSGGVRRAEHHKTVAREKTEKTDWSGIRTHARRPVP